MRHCKDPAPHGRLHRTPHAKPCRVCPPTGHTQCPQPTKTGACEGDCSSQTSHLTSKSSLPYRQLASTLPQKLGMEDGDAEGCIVVPLQSGEEVEVPRSELPDDVADVIAMLRKECVPLRLWVDFGVRVAPDSWVFGGLRCCNLRAHPPHALRWGTAPIIYFVALAWLLWWVPPRVGFVHRLHECASTRASMCEMRTLLPTAGAPAEAVLITLHPHQHLSNRATVL